MTGPPQRALLFLDVDGPLLPFGAAEYPNHGTDPRACDADANPLLARLDPGHGPRLLRLPCDLVWATAWMEEANTYIAPRLGLPELAVVIWPEQTEVDDRDERAGLHWKTRTLVVRAAGRPFVWVDDELTDTDRAWVAAHHRSSALLHHVDPRRGLTEADFTTVATWLRSPHVAPPSPPTT
ncbi:HAD domain-containing protein [Embleya sp. NPDC050493]|uniref:HAD domain-containing protein n=1 Tax=Embleya sp. NPDC050493 TaxID=3363989 RepID=UPI0037B74EB9